MKLKIWIYILSAIFILSLGAAKALAVDMPSFPTCSNPQGTITISYNDGTHGIVGSTMQYSGSDTVYQLDANSLQQCFCSTDGSGIQTNWWKISSLDQEQLQILKNAGWIYVPNGALWGLQETPYMALNSSFSCLGNNSNNNSNNNSGGGSDGKSDGKSDGQGCGNHDCSGNKVGQVLGASTSILGASTSVLAATGGNYLPFVLAIVGAATVAFGLILNHKSSQK